MKKKDDNIEDKETLMSVLLKGDNNKTQEYLLKNGKKKSYCPIYFKKDTDSNFSIE